MKFIVDSVRYEHVAEQEMMTTSSSPPCKSTERGLTFREQMACLHATQCEQDVTHDVSQEASLVCEDVRLGQTDEEQFVR